MRLIFAYAVLMFNVPEPRLCDFAILAREKQVNVRVIPTSNAIEESIDLSHEIFNRVFRRVPAKMG